MQNWLLAGIGCCLFVPVFAQNALSPSLRVPEVQESPESNIDLLKKSLQTGGNAVGVSGAAAPAKQEPATSATSPEKKAPAEVTPNKKSASSTTTTTTTTTLDMPLDVGGQTQSVQATVAPVKKTNSTPSIKRVSAAKTSVPMAASTATVTQPATDNVPSAVAETSGEESSEEAAADAELEYAVRMLEESKAKAQAAERTIPPPAGPG